MVQASSFVVATVALGAVSTLALPVSQETRELDERNFWQTLKKDVGAVAGTALKIGSKFIREEDALALRNFDDEVTARNYEELSERNFWQTLKKDVGAVAGTALKIGSKFIREEDELAARELDEELSQRELDERNFWQTLKKDVGAVAGTALKIGSKFIREEDELAAREYQDEPLSARDFDEISERELDERNFWQTLKKDVGAVAGTALKIGSKFIREEDELAAREFDEELSQRELDERNFWQTLKKDVGAVAGTALKIGSKFIREEDELAAREFEELSQRELDERNFWQTLKKDVGAVAGTALKIGSKFIREEDDLSARDYDEVFERDYNNMEELD